MYPSDYSLPLTSYAELMLQHFSYKLLLSTDLIARIFITIANLRQASGHGFIFYKCYYQNHRQKNSMATPPLSITNQLHLHHNLQPSPPPATNRTRHHSRSKSTTPEPSHTQLPSAHPQSLLSDVNQSPQFAVCIHHFTIHTQLSPSPPMSITEPPPSTAATRNISAVNSNRQPATRTSACTTLSSLQAAKHDWNKTSQQSQLQHHLTTSTGGTITVNAAIAAT